MYLKERKFKNNCVFFFIICHSLIFFFIEFAQAFNLGIQIMCA